MPVIHHVNPRSGDVVLLVGTMKGAFVLRGGAGRRDWEVGGPYFPGSAVYALADDARAGRPHVNIFVDGEDIRHTGGLDAPVRDGSEIFLIAAVSGG